ncbi:MAG TPA: STAS-like domain-containing protein [Gemmatimonadota bacterium]|nr:STAS-like domain-containing protein [Gemmatimonadota bacterium]
MMRERVTIDQYCSSAGTRERGRRVYPEILKAAEGDRDLEISFEKIDFVSPSFLDETVVRLVEEDPSIAKRITVIGLQPFAARMLKTALGKLGISTEIVKDTTERRAS